MYSPMNQMEDKQFREKDFRMLLKREKSLITIDVNLDLISPSTNDETKNLKRVSNSVNLVFCQKKRI